LYAIAKPLVSVIAVTLPNKVIPAGTVVCKAVEPVESVIVIVDITLSFTK